MDKLLYVPSYGYVRDVGIVTDSDTGAFLGSGYAVLDCTSDSSQPDPFLDLAHIMPWVDPHNPETDDCSVYIHAYWKEMPTYCKYCHELGHSASECQQAPSNKRVCYYCYKPGHIRVQCPDKISPAKRLRGSHKSKTTMPSPKNTMVDAVKTVELLDNQNGSTIRSSIQDQPQESRVDSPTTAPIPNEDTVEDILSVPSKTREHIQYADDVSMSDISEQSNNEGSIQSQWATTSEPFSSPETDTGSSNIDPPVVSTSETKKTTKDSSTTGPRRSTRATRPPDRLDFFFKVSNPSSRHHLIRYIRSRSPSFVALQEIDNCGASLPHQNILHQQFCCQQSLWTKYCGLLCFDPQFTISRIPLPEDSRCILAQVDHIDGHMEPFHILVVYAPASSSKARAEFFESILNFRQLSPLDTISCVDRLIIAGDFNYSISTASSTRNSRPPQQWVHFLQCHFRNVMSDLRSLVTPTFRRGELSHSTIDYIYMSLDLAINYVDADVEFLNPHWTDHALLTLVFKPDLPTPSGPGLWRANPTYKFISPAPHHRYYGTWLS
ncbi:hypothetical protein G6F52_011815 [Rhizopus delemar]|nr:hypothetical protein G6F52_011815 [Rhizopus delemar]